MDLLTNAIESIQVGIEDWQVGSRPRLLSAVRNIHAGILLLFKEALLRESPQDSHEVFIKAQTKPVKVDGQVRLVGVGRKTVDGRQIRERFKDLGISADWKLFDGIADVRNDIEHYFADITQDSLRGVVASAFLLIRAFVEEELEEEPRKLLGQKTWDVMLRAEQVYAAERSQCDKLFNEVDWGSVSLAEGVKTLRCRKCGSDLLRPEVGESNWESSLTCRSCGDEMDGEAFVPIAVAEAFDLESYLAAKGEADDPIAECPQCNLETYVMAEGRCALCGEAAEHECEICGSEIPASEFGSSPICGWCDHMASKDD